MKEDLLKESFGTLSETINGLINLGYNHDFNVQKECLICQQKNITLSPEYFQIDKVYRFEGASNPEDQAILYAISSTKFGIKGTLVNGYGISSDETFSKLIEKLQTNKTDVSKIFKTLDATPQRPEGNRVLNAPLVEISISEFIDQIKNETTWADSDRNSVTIFKSETMRIVLIGLHENAELKPHKANGVISVQVIDGKINFITDQQSTIIEKGQMIALQENITHSVIALTESFFLLTLAMNRK
ncbi:MAG TPA: cupin domain-containing protein [Ignavibacteria bacterium]|nr:cupin domain-containing protein [Ignavibacteria bacterium]HQY52852.1 cupin domain-containing protein [Ignavibacteria bacterium]HRB00835.1 cupin domain-containing protein [Ignavibacteria bacterium]